MPTVYGIRNCDTVRKARRWLDDTALRALLLEQPTLVKRPVLEDGDDVVVGFDADAYAARFAGRGA